MQQLIVVTGPPCSGKSTLAAALGPALGAQVLDVDAIRVAVLPHSEQSREDRNIAYRCMHLVAKALFEARVGCLVLAATYGRRQPRQWLRALAAHTGARVAVVACRVDPAVAAARWRSRRPDHAGTDLTEDGVRRQAANFDYSAAFVLDATLEPQALVAAVDGHLHDGAVPDLAHWASHGSEAP